MPSDSNLSFPRLPAYDPATLNEHTPEELNSPYYIHNDSLYASMATAGSVMGPTSMAAPQWSGQDGNWGFHSSHPPYLTPTSNTSDDPGPSMVYAPPYYAYSGSEVAPPTLRPSMQPNAVTLGPKIAELPQKPYTRGGVIEEGLAEVITFKSGGRNGVRLGKPDLLDHGDHPAFHKAVCLKSKASLRFGLKGVRQRQIYVRTVHGEPVSRRKLFDAISKEIQLAMNRGTRLRYMGVPIHPSRIVLLRVEHISKGSLRPVLGVLLDK